jgi:superfamily II DNA or RNA helicase
VLELDKAVGHTSPIYFIPEDDLVGEVLIPAIGVCEELWIGSGFFSSRCLAQVAPGLAGLLEKSDGPVRLLASPELSQTDQAAINQGLSNASEVGDNALLKILKSSVTSSAELQRHCLDCLSHLVASGRLEIRVVLMKAGMYHKKAWFTREGNDWLAVHGSGNVTERGLLVNGEQMTIDKAWRDGPVSHERVHLFVRQYERQWTNDDPHSLTIVADQAMNFLKTRHAGGLEVPTVSDFWAAWRADHDAGLEPVLPPGVGAPTRIRALRIPQDLDWREGRYSHQGDAVDAFLPSGRGIFSIATGGGKTKASLIAASLLAQAKEGPFLVLILAPSRPLIAQWTKEVAAFEVEPYVFTNRTPQQRAAMRLTVEASLESDRPHCEVILATNQMYASDQSFRDWLDRVAAKVNVMLIVDEVHNFGSGKTLEVKSDAIQHRLGLSATPVRQYDSEGTESLFAYFGEILAEFTLREAIESGCLVPYDYFPHIVELTDDEAELYAELTEKLSRTGFRVDTEGRSTGLTAAAESILRRRRAIVEQADGKLETLRQLLRAGDTGEVRRSLVYCSAKETMFERRRQIERVNDLLADVGIISHQVTQAETGSARAEKLLAAFGRGEYQVLTAMKVLDEGLDIPQTETAFILASSSVEREWVQRRGRVLRRSPGKEFATLHDFVVIPPDPADSSIASLVSSELRRVRAFSMDSRNEFDPDGGDQVTREIESHSRGSR